MLYPIKGNGVKGYLSHIKPIKRILKEGGFDVIHAHYGLCGLVSYFAKHKQKLVVSYMGDDLIGEADEHGRYTFKGEVIKKINQFFARYINAANIVKSDQMAAVIPKALPHVLPNGVNFELFYPISQKEARDQLGLASDKLLALFVADPERTEKNYPLAKQGFDLVKHQNKELIVLKKESQQRLNLFYNAADVLLLTSFHEGSPNVIKEAMACSRPIVSTRVGDVEKMAGRTKGCFLIDYNPKDLAEKLVEASKYASGTSGREDISHIREENIAQRIISIYKSVA